MVGFCEYGNASLGSIKSGKFFGQLPVFQDFLCFRAIARSTYTIDLVHSSLQKISCILEVVIVHLYLSAMPL